VQRPATLVGEQERDGQRCWWASMSAEASEALGLQVHGVRRRRWASRSTVTGDVVSQQEPMYICSSIFGTIF
jgi:hypothetical protein